jgi:hypothetical protein
LFSTVAEFFEDEIDSLNLRHLLGGISLWLQAQ